MSDHRHGRRGRLTLDWQRAGGEFYGEGFRGQSALSAGSLAEPAAGRVGAASRRRDRSTPASAAAPFDGDAGGSMRSRDCSLSADLLGHLPSRRRPSYHLPPNIVSGKRVWTGTSAGGRLQNSNTIEVSYRDECVALCDSDIPDESQIDEMVEQIRYMALSMREKRIRRRRILNSAILRVQGWHRVRHHCVTMCRRLCTVLHSLLHLLHTLVTSCCCCGHHYLRQLSASCSPAAAAQLQAVRSAGLLHMVLSALLLFNWLLLPALLPSSLSSSSSSLSLSSSSSLSLSSSSFDWRCAGGSAVYHNGSQSDWQTGVAQLLTDSLTLSGVWLHSPLYTLPYYTHTAPATHAAAAAAAAHGAGTELASNKTLPTTLAAVAFESSQLLLLLLLFVLVWLLVLVTVAAGWACRSLVQPMRACRYWRHLLAESRNRDDMSRHRPPRHSCRARHCCSEGHLPCYKPPTATAAAANADTSNGVSRRQVASGRLRHDVTAALLTSCDVSVRCADSGESVRRSLASYLRWLVDVSAPPAVASSGGGGGVSAGSTEHRQSGALPALLLLLLLLVYLLLGVAHCCGVYWLSKPSTAAAAVAGGSGGLLSWPRLPGATELGANPVWSGVSATVWRHYSGPLAAVLGSTVGARVLCACVAPLYSRSPCPLASLHMVCGYVWRSMAAASVLLARWQAPGVQQLPVAPADGLVSATDAAGGGGGDERALLSHCWQTSWQLQLLALTCYQLLVCELVSVFVVKMALMSPVRVAALSLWRSHSSTPSTDWSRVWHVMPERLVVDTGYVQLVSWSGAVAAPLLPLLAAVHSLAVFHSVRALCVWCGRDLAGATVSVGRYQMSTLYWRVSQWLLQLVGVSLAGCVAIAFVGVASWPVAVAWLVVTAAVWSVVGVAYVRAVLRTRSAQMALLCRRVQLGTQDSRYLLERVCEIDSMARRRLGAAGEHTRLASSQEAADLSSLDLADTGTESRDHGAPAEQLKVAAGSAPNVSAAAD